MPDVSGEFLRICKERLDAGEAKYGPVRADDRNRSREAIEEIWDSFNYIVPIMLAKHPRMKLQREWEHAVTLCYRLYKTLLELEKVEKGMEETLKKGG